MPPKRQVQDQGEEEVEDIALPEGGDVSKLLKEMNIPDGTVLCIDWVCWIRITFEISGRQRWWDTGDMGAVSYLYLNNI